MTPAQHPEPAEMQQEEQPEPLQHLGQATGAVDEEGGGAFFWDAHKAAAVGPPPATTPGQHLEGTAADGGGGGFGAPPAASPTGDVGDADAYTGADRISVFTFLKIATWLSGLYMCTNPWFLFYDADKGEICPYTVICATTPVELALLTASRLSAGLLYASLSISIMSKCYATRSYLHHSWLGAVLDLEPSHDAHTYFGSLTLVAGFEHGIIHCIRFIVADEAWIIYRTHTGRSGMVACLLLLPIVLPMKFDFFKKRMSFQSRKNLHMLFLALLVALCFHSAHFRYVGSVLLLWYCLDRFYFTTKQTFLINHPVFEAVGRGTMVGLDLPEGYTFKAGSFIYVNSPTISRSEWHPFSIIQVPGRTPKAAFYAEAVGDWTQELFRLGLGKPRLPLWISAAQPSLMEKSIYYDNVVLVCTGAGITPAVSIIERFAQRKNIHLMWMTRDSGMVALFEKQLRKVNSTVHLTGKQTDQTKDALRRLLEPPRSQVEDLGTSFRSILTTDWSFRPGMPSRTGADTGIIGVDAAEAGMSAVYAEACHGRNHAVFLARATSDGRTPRAHPSRWDSFAGDDLNAGPNLPPPPPPPRLPADSYYRHSHAESSGDGGGGGDAASARQQRPERFVSNMSHSSVVTTTSIKPPADPVTLEFGRPDIGKYLAETFTMIPESSTTSTSREGRAGGRHGETLSRSSVSRARGKVTPVAASAAERAGAARRQRRVPSDESVRLDSAQKVSKAILLLPDIKVTGVVRPGSKITELDGPASRKQQLPTTQGSDNNSSMASTASPLPWLVLYCGANPRVEEAIATTCDDLRVEWKKEYFGAW